MTEVIDQASCLHGLQRQTDQALSITSHDNLHMKIVNRMQIPVLDYKIQLDLNSVEYNTHVHLNPLMLYITCTLQLALIRTKERLELLP